MLYTTYILVWKLVRDIVLIVVVTSLIVSFFTFRGNAYPATEIGDRTPETIKFQYENINFAGTDGVALKGWFVPTEEKKADEIPGTIICLHGYGMTKADALDWCHFLHEKYNLFLFDFRGHGDSENKPVSFGINESNDVLGAIEYLKTRPDVDRSRIGVMGYDLGANAGIIAAAVTAEIKVIVADSPFDQFSTRLEGMYLKYSFMKKPLSWMTGQWFHYLAKANPSELKPVESIGQTTAAILLIAPEDDIDQSANSARKLYQAAVTKNIDLWTVPGDYDNLFFNNRNDYLIKVSEFFKKHL